VVAFGEQNIGRDHFIFLPADARTLSIDLHLRCQNKQFNGMIAFFKAALPVITKAPCSLTKISILSINICTHRPREITKQLY